MLDLGDTRGNIQLEPGDVVYVPDVGKVALVGAFVHSGLVDFDPKLSLMQYIAEGGVGSAETTILQKGILIRPHSDGTYETVKLDLSRLTDGIVPEPVKIKPGDIIYFEPKGAEKKSLWDIFSQVLWTAGSLVSLGVR
jgi:hypothetical protein